MCDKYRIYRIRTKIAFIACDIAFIVCDITFIAFIACDRMQSHAIEFIACDKCDRICRMRMRACDKNLLDMTV
jgi:hypothetical protein